jgi:hypothetical protein
MCAALSMPMSRRAVRMATVKPPSTSTKAVTMIRKNTEVAARSTSRNSTIMPMNSSIDSM